jgi:CHAT domain
VYIALKGIGYIDVSYAENGIATTVNSFKEDGTPGARSIGVKVTNLFQRMLDFIKKFDPAATTGITVPDLGLPDTKLVTLDSIVSVRRSSYNKNANSATKKAWLIARFNLATYYFEHNYYRADYDKKCAETAWDIFTQGNRSDDEAVRHLMVSNITLFHSLMLKTRRKGVARDNWDKWVLMVSWIKKEKQAQTSLNPYRRSLETLQDSIAARPVVLLASSEWLPKSILRNKAWWRYYGEEHFHRRTFGSGATFNKIFFRTNKDLLAGTSNGLFVLRNGYWEHFVWDQAIGKLIGYQAGVVLDELSNINAMAETDDGQLLLGVNGGLIVVKGDYEKGEATLYTDLDGLPDRIVLNAQPLPDGSSIIKTLKGHCIYNNGKITNIPQLNGKQIQFIRSMKWPDGNDSLTKQTLIGTDKDVMRCSKSGKGLVFSSFLNGNYEDAILDDKDQLFLLKSKTLYKLEMPVNHYNLRTTIPDDQVGEIYGNIVTTAGDKIFGLCRVPVTGDETAVGVLTDHGISLFHENNLETFDNFNDFTSHRLEPVQCDIYNNTIAIMCSGEVLLFDYQAADHERNKVKALLSDSVHRMMLIADESGLKAQSIDSDLNQQATAIMDGNTTAMTLDFEHRLIANDNNYIYSFVYDSTDGQYKKGILFSIDNPEDKYVYDILAARDSSLWITAKESLYHCKIRSGTFSDGEWKYDVTVDTFNFKSDMDKFPSYSDWLYKTYETNQGKIWVVCSDEGHLYYKNMSLKGGLLEWDPATNTFVPLNLSRDDDHINGFDWFITSYTPVSENKAIVGTLSGFAEDNRGAIRNIDYDSTAFSYLDIKSRYPSLFLGTAGARLKDSWLFGCASGVLMYMDGNWFYPDRLNQLLPSDVELSNYGSRKINAIATTANGRLYIGTDLGLAKFDLGAEEPVAFLFNNTDIFKAAAYLNRNLLISERDATLNSLNPNTEPGRLVSGIKTLEKLIQAAQRTKGDKERQKLHSNIPRSIDAMDSVGLNIKLLYKQEADTLLALQQKYPALYQLQKVDPLDLLTFSKELKPDQGIIQYLPMTDRLYIQFYRNKLVVNKEVNISFKALKDTISYISKCLTDSALDWVLTDSATPSNAHILAGLRYLYNILLKPIEVELSEVRNIYINATGNLFSVPFSALVYPDAKNTFHFAVEKYSFGYLSSMYMVGLLDKINGEFGRSNLIMGDPAGNLAGARWEAQEVGRLLNNKPLLGKDATSASFESLSVDSRYIHLATHGHLDRDNLANSWLLFSDRKFAMDEVYGMSLGNTEMVVLSACETAAGTDGIEYATIARAFVSAHVPTIIATLWKVSDLSAKDLMSQFYLNLQKEQSKFQAFAAAQRSMLASGKRRLASPNKWAGYILMGKP